MPRPILGYNKSQLERMRATGQLSVFWEQRKLRTELRAALTKYVDKIRDNISCKHCGAKQYRARGHCHVVWHHPDEDGHLGRVNNLILAFASIAEIDAEIDRCVPLCNSCHGKEHGRMKRETASFGQGEITP